MSFEKEYYESPEFWAEGMVADEGNLQRIQETINLIPGDTLSLLDVGCGNGIFPNTLNIQKTNIRVTATDRSQEALQYVKTDKFESDIANLPIKNNAYDCVTCLQVIEHLPHQIYKTALSELARVSKKYVIVSVPFNEDITRGFTQCPHCLSQFNSDLHFRNFDLATMKGLFLDFGFSLQSNKNVVRTSKLVGIELYSKIISYFKKQPAQIFNSPICPVCGFINNEFRTNMANTLTNTPKKKGLKVFIKTIWPKVEVPGYWIIALYQRSGS